MEIDKIINLIKNHLLSIELSSDGEDKKNHLIVIKQEVENLSVEYQKLKETHDTIISQLKQEISRLNRL
jgi:hypothetical protein